MSRRAKKDNVEKIFNAHQPQLKSFIRKRVSNEEDTEDILQDVFYQLIKTVETDSDPIEQVTAWLYRVTRNTIINQKKKIKEDEYPTSNTEGEEDILMDFSEVLFNDDNATPETEYLRSLVWQELESALAELPDEQSQAFVLTELDELPVKEVAQIMNVPVNTLLSRKHYAVKHLRNKLEVLYLEILAN